MFKGIYTGNSNKLMPVSRNELKAGSACQWTLWPMSWPCTSHSNNSSSDWVVPLHLGTCAHMHMVNCICLHPQNTLVSFEAHPILFTWAFINLILHTECKNANLNIKVTFNIHQGIWQLQFWDKNFTVICHRLGKHWAGLKKFCLVNKRQCV